MDHLDCLRPCYFMAVAEACSPVRSSCHVANRKLVAPPIYEEIQGDGCHNCHTVDDSRPKNKLVFDTGLCTIIF